MERKDFLCLGATALLGGTSIFSANAEVQKSKDSFRKIHIPPYLQQGDTIGITSPAGYILLEDLQPAIQQLHNWGFQVKIGQTIGQRDGTLGGTDDARAADFNEMLHDPQVKAILCARGGYGLVRIIDRINFSRFRKQPKWILGFSDITVLHCHIQRNYGIATIHSKMCNSFPHNWDTATPIQQQCILSIKDCLLHSKPMQYQTGYSQHNKLGKAKGILIGGNLRTIENLAGTDSDLDTKGKILFIEDVDEPLYNIDRMLWSLKRTGKLSQLAALLVGGFKIKDPTDLDSVFSKDLFELVTEKTKEYCYPVAFDFPVGHQVNNFALKCGVRHELSVTNTATILNEI